MDVVAQQLVAVLQCNGDWSPVSAGAESPSKFANRSHCSIVASEPLDSHLAYVSSDLDVRLAGLIVGMEPIAALVERQKRCARSEIEACIQDLA
jgi:hypothetical protein